MPPLRGWDYRCYPTFLQRFQRLELTDSRQFSNRTISPATIFVSKRIFETFWTCLKGNLKTFLLSPNSFREGNFQPIISISILKYNHDNIILLNRWETSFKKVICYSPLPSVFKNTSAALVWQLGLHMASFPLSYLISFQIEFGHVIHIKLYSLLSIITFSGVGWVLIKIFSFQSWGNNSVKCLPHKQGDLSSILRTHSKNPGIVVCASNSSSWER